MDKLGNYIEQIRGVSYKNNEVTDKHLEGYSVVLRANSIKDYKLSLENLVYVKNDLIKEKQILKKYDILMAASSGSKEIVGKMVQILEDTDFSFGAFCKLIRCKKNINPKYVAYFFRTEEYRRTISHLVCGANINNIKNEHIDNLLIDVPSLDTQNQIVRILDQAQELIDKRKAQIEALDELIQSVFYDMFGTMNIKDTKWDIVKLKDISSYFIGLTYKPEDVKKKGVVVLRSTNIQNNVLDLTDMLRVDKKINDRLLVENGDILMCSRNGSARLVGKVAKIPKLDEPMTFGAFMTIIRSNYNTYRNYSA